MSKVRVAYCCDCKRKTRHIYAGREKNGIAEEVTLGVITLGLAPLVKLATGVKIGGKTFWECTKCGRINET